MKKLPFHDFNTEDAKQLNMNPRQNTSAPQDQIEDGLFPPGAWREFQERVERPLVRPKYLQSLTHRGFPVFLGQQQAAALHHRLFAAFMGATAQLSAVSTLTSSSPHILNRG